MADEPARSRNLLKRNPLRGRFVAAGETPASILCLPNVISLLRIALIPVFLWLLLADAAVGVCTASDPPICGGFAFVGAQNGPLRWIAAALFIVAIATDAIDGHLARSRNLVTDFGIFLDPVADKGITGAALIGLAILGELPWWVVAIILIREIGITVYRAIALKDRVIPASRGGKLKTIIQAVAIALALLPLATLLGGWVAWVNGAVMTAAVVLTVITGADYLWRARRRNREHA